MAHDANEVVEEKAIDKSPKDVSPDRHDDDIEVGIVNKAAPLKRGLHNRHMQMIAIGE